MATTLQVSEFPASLTSSPAESRQIKVEKRRWSNVSFRVGLPGLGSSIVAWTGNCSAPPFCRLSQWSYLWGSRSELWGGEDTRVQPLQKPFADQHAPLLESCYWLDAAADLIHRHTTEDSYKWRQIKSVSLVCVHKSEQQKHHIQLYTFIKTEFNYLFSPTNLYYGIS